MICRYGNLNSFYDEGADFSLILAGLPLLLSRTLSLSVNEPMKQRINFSIELDAFTPVETMNYIKHQMNVSKKCVIYSANIKQSEDDVRKRLTHRVSF